MLGLVSPSAFGLTWLWLNQTCWDLGKNIFRTIESLFYL